MTSESDRKIVEEKWDKDKVYRTTRCFSPSTNGYPGGFPLGFMKWVKENGWFGNQRVYLCSGKVEDNDAIRVDLNPECNPTHLEDAAKTSIPNCSADWVMVDPPYTRELAESLYNQGKNWHRIDAFAKEASRICKPGGLILTLSYEVPRRIPDSNFIAVVGVYQAIQVAHMRCFTVSRKELKKENG